MELEPGQLVAGYRVDGVVGRGATGVVYRAQQERPQRTVAVKLLSGELSGDAGFRAWFARAAEVIASREHPNILPVYDVGEVDGHLFVATRLVDGGDLGKALAAGPIAPARAVRILERLASALESAHAAGLAHGNLKPSNVLLSGSGDDEHVYLTDFGLPYPAGDYAAPEQARGAGADARTDVYALGRLMSTALSGQPDPNAAGTPLPPRFAELLAMATGGDPASRFATPTAFARAAAAALAAKAAPAFPPIAPAAKPAPPPVPVAPAPPAAPVPVAAAPRSSGVPPWWIIAGVATVAAAIVLAALLMRDGGGDDLQRAAATPTASPSPTPTPTPATTPDADADADAKEEAARKRADRRRRQAREARKRRQQPPVTEVPVPSAPTGGPGFHTGTDPGESVPAAYCRMSPSELYCWTPNDGYTLRIAGGVAQRVHADEPGNRGYTPGDHSLLAIGETRSLYGHSCTSRSSGLSCQGAQGGGWTLPRYRGEASFY